MTNERFGDSKLTIPKKDVGAPPHMTLALVTSTFQQRISNLFSPPRKTNKRKLTQWLLKRMSPMPKFGTIRFW